MNRAIPSQGGRRDALSLTVFFAVLLIADQITKQLALQNLGQASVVDIIPGFFRLVLVFNPGAAFGLFAALSDDVRRLVLWLVTLLALSVVFRLFFFEARHDRVSRYALVAVLSGAIGNMIDRFRFDSVVDFLDFYVGEFHWPAFNVADSAICLGIFVIALRLGFGDEAEEDGEGSGADALGPQGKNL